MPVKPFIPVMLAVLLAALLPPAVVAADVLVFCLDTSGSMQKQGRFEAAKSLLAQQIRETQPGDVIYVIAFDSNDYPIGRLDVGEDGSPEAKEQLLAKIQVLKAKGRYTNLDEPLQAAKAFLLEERAPGARKILILSDGLSDPSPDHSKLDLKGIAEMIPQTLAWAVYLVGLPDDIAGLFQTQPLDIELVLAPEAPHIKGIAIKDFSRDLIKVVPNRVKNDALPFVPPPPLPPLQSVPEPAPAPPPEVPEPPALPRQPEVSPPLMQAIEVPPSPFSTLLWVLGALLLAVVGGCLLVPRRVAGKPRAAFVLEVQEETGDAKRVPLVLGEGEKKTLGPRGDIPLEGHPELPAVVGALRWSLGRLWLTPQDTMTVNGRSVTSRTPVGPGDQLKVRDSVRIMIDEGEETTDAP
ncbi:MAG: VWA domain-containing protein [Armatimonadetes bacterium]|nr:VWA domain-containing protein [Armatimonadota bacterium]